MNITITILSYDHGILREVFDVLDDMVRSGKLDEHRDVMPEVSDFLQEFMDHYHHGKEERFIFPQAENGPDKLKEAVPRLIEEHRKAKAYADAIKVGIGSWDVPALSQNLVDLVAHMRNHIVQEEDFVFPAIEALIDSDKDMTIFDQSQVFLKENFGEDYQQKMEKFANGLQERVWGKGVIKFPSQ
jgi:hemerythrin-like domain-containing protein